MNKIYKSAIYGTVIAIFLIFFSIYSFKVMDLLNIVNRDKKVSTPELAIEQIESEDPSKSIRDLLDVDYNTFYDDLEPYGTWIKVDLSDVGPDKISKTDADKDLSSTLRKIFGINDANAYAEEANWGVFYVWKPSPMLSVSLAAGNATPMYIPYTNGRWVYSDYGWYFNAPTPYEEIVHHYGRWVFVPTEGWIWIPGSVWAPSWVEWEEDDYYVGWAPVVPRLYFSLSVFPEPFYTYRHYIVVERRYLFEPDIYRYCNTYWEYENRKHFRNMTIVSGLSYREGFIYNHGPKIERFEKDFGKKFNPVHINMVSDRNRVHYSDNEYNIFSPKIKYRDENQLSRYKNVRDFTNKHLVDKNTQGKNGSEFLFKEGYKENNKNFFPGKDGRLNRDDNNFRHNKIRDNKTGKNENKSYERKNDNNKSDKNTGFRKNERTKQDNNYNNNKSSRKNDDNYLSGNKNKKNDNSYKTKTRNKKENFRGNKNDGNKGNYNKNSRNNYEPEKGNKSGNYKENKGKDLNYKQNNSGKNKGNNKNNYSNQKNRNPGKFNDKNSGKGNDNRINKNSGNREKQFYEHNDKGKNYNKDLNRDRNKNNNSGKNKNK